MIKLTINCDGGSRGNPGPAGIGCLIVTDKNHIKLSKYIDKATNNQAEYKAVIEALKYLNKNYANLEIEAEFLLDSQLVVEQLNERYKLKNEGLKPLFWQIGDLMAKLSGKITFTHIPREKNKI